MESPWLKFEHLKLVDKSLGEGDFGKVWKALHDIDKTHYAIKQVFVKRTLRHYEGDVQKLLREVQNLQNIDSLHVVKYFNCWLEGPSAAQLLQNDFLPVNDEECSSTQPLPPEVDFLFIQMELCESNLKTWLREHKTTDSRAPMIPDLLIQLSKGLQSIHDKGIVHRDLKPDNIFLKTLPSQNEEHGEKLIIWKIGDFGLSAKDPEENLIKNNSSAHQSFAGCLTYRSPEMESHGHFNKKSDVYSLGLIFLEILYPFQTETQKRRTFFKLQNEKECRKIITELIPSIYSKEVELVKVMLDHRITKRIDIQQALQMLTDSESIVPEKLLKSKKQNANKKSKKNSSQSNQQTDVGTSIPAYCLSIKRPIRFQIRPPVSTFTGRKQELKSISSLFKQQKSNGLKNIVVLEGLGGIGKTNLARKFAELFSTEYNGDVIWVFSETSGTLNTSWQDLFDNKLKIKWDPKKNTESLELFYNIFQTSNNQLLRSTKKSNDASIETQFIRLPPPPTLIIFDNAEVLKRDKSSSGNLELFDYLPHSHEFYTNDYLIPYFLITTRRNNFISNGQRLKLAPLLIEEAMEFVRNVLTTPENEEPLPESDIHDLCTCLQNFPLALQQAVAFIKENEGMSYTISKYVEDFKTKKAKMLLNSTIFIDSTEDSYELMTLITWNISLENIKRVAHIGQLSMTVLQTIAFLPAENIPCKFVSAVLTPEDEKYSEQTESDLIRVFTLPEKYSMYTLNQSAITVHRLVQKVTQINLADDLEDVAVLRKMIQGCLKLFDYFENERIQEDRRIDNMDELQLHFLSGESSWEDVLQSMIPCIISTWEFAIKHKVLLEEFIDFPIALLKTVKKTSKIDMLWETNVIMHTCQSIQKMYQDEPMTLLQTLKDLVNKTIDSSSKVNVRIAEKEKLKVYKMLYELNCQILGYDNPETHKSLVDYSFYCIYPPESLPDRESVIKEGLKLFDKEYQRRKQTLGPNHESTLDMRKKMAEANKSINRSEALKIFQEVLSLERIHFGVQHERTINTLLDMAHLYMYHNSLDGMEIINFVPVFKALFEIEKLCCSGILITNKVNTSFQYGQELAKIYSIRLSMFKKAAEVLEEIYEKEKQLSSSPYSRTFEFLMVERIRMLHEELFVSFSRCDKCSKFNIKCTHESSNPKIKRIVEPLLFYV